MTNCVYVCVCVCVCVYTQGINAAFCDRLSEWQIDTYAVHLHPDSDLPAADQPAALRAALGQLCGGLQVVGLGEDSEGSEDRWESDSVSSMGSDTGLGDWARSESGWEPCIPYLDVSKWAATPDIFRTCAPYLHEFDEPKLPQIEQLTDDMLSAVLGLAPHLRTLTAAALSLQSDQHASAVWPWDEQSIHVVDVTQLLRLPDPGAGGAAAAGGAGGLPHPGPGGAASVGTGAPDGRGGTGTGMHGGEVVGTDGEGLAGAEGALGAEGVTGDARADGGMGVLRTVACCHINISETITKVSL